MKKFYKILSYAALVVAACSATVATSTTSVEAYSSSYLTQTAPQTYYANVNTSLTGEQFRKNLSTIISAGYVKNSYSYANTVLAESDENPNNPGKQTGFYSGQALSSGSWNREHVWAKSHGFATESWAPYSDCHHLRPTLNSINSSRGSKDFGEIPGATADQYGNKTNSTLFEPRDEVKGDVARIMFYMATRYGFEAPYNLTLTNDTTTSISKTGNGKFGNLDTLIKWHYQDPVSDEEIYRNNVVYKYQNNRNPYIDHPEYVDLAYPSQYSSNVTVDNAKVEEVINKINTIPEVVTLENKVAVNDINSLYQALNYKEKALVTNYSTLQAALNTINKLENPEGSSSSSSTSSSGSSSTSTSNSTQSGAVSIDFTKYSSTSLPYTNNYKTTFDGKEIFFSCAGIYSEYRFGRDNNVSIPDNLNPTSASLSGHYMTLNFDVENASAIKITNVKNYGTIKAWYLLASYDGGTNYELLNSGSGYSDIMEANLTTAKTARFALVVDGSKPRIVLSKLDIYTQSGSSTGGSDSGNAGYIDLSNEGINVSLSVSYKIVNHEITANVAMNFKSTLTDKYTNKGIIYSKTSELADIDFEDWYEDETLEQFLNLSSEFKSVTGVHASISGVDIDEKYSAVGYVYEDGEIHFTNQTTFSIREVIEYYLNNNLITDATQAIVLHSLLNN